MTLLETRNLPANKLFGYTLSLPEFYWDESGVLCDRTGRVARLTKEMLDSNFIIQCDHKHFFPVGAGTSWHLKCADCLCDLIITGVREIHPPEAPK